MADGSGARHQTERGGSASGKDPVQIKKAYINVKYYTYECQDSNRCTERRQAMYETDKITVEFLFDFLCFLLLQCSIHGECEYDLKCCLGHWVQFEGKTPLQYLQQSSLVDDKVGLHLMQGCKPSCAI